jgi:hypothetical protein
MSTLNMQSKTILEAWLRRATCGLSIGSSAQVRSEIEDHYEAAREEALGHGATPEEADHIAVASLGDARVAGRQYRQVLLTSSEAGMLSEARWETRLLCPLFRWMTMIPVAMLTVAIWFFATGNADLGVLLTVGAVGPGLLVVSPLLPIHTPAQGRVFRGLRWAWLAAVLIVAAWPDLRRQWWLIATCAISLSLVEWTLFSLRRKLPVAKWPRLLYL